MDRKDILSTLKRHREEFEALGVEHLCLFGSVAREENTIGSDVDVMATFRQEARPGLKVVELHRRLEEILGRPVDLLRAPVKHTGLRRAISEEGVHAF